jgi:hypothetical protein
MLDRAVWTFAVSVEAEQEAMVGRLPKNAKPEAQDRVRQTVLDAFLDIDHTKAPGRFRDPANRG